MHEPTNKTEVELTYCFTCRKLKCESRLMKNDIQKAWDAGCTESSCLVVLIFFSSPFFTRVCVYFIHLPRMNVRLGVCLSYWLLERESKNDLT